MGGGQPGLPHIQVSEKKGASRPSHHTEPSVVLEYFLLGSPSTTSLHPLATHTLLALYVASYKEISTITGTLPSGVVIPLVSCR